MEGGLHAHGTGAQRATCRRAPGGCVHSGVQARPVVDYRNSKVKGIVDPLLAPAAFRSLLGDLSAPLRSHILGALLPALRAKSLGRRVFAVVNHVVGFIACGNAVGN